MPPKAKYTREQIIDKAFELAREKGPESIAAREIGKRLGTSSSPIFTAFKNMEELHKEVRKRALKEFESYVGNAMNHTPAFKYVGMKMVEFAGKEPNLFRMVCMREHDDNQTFAMLVDELGDTVNVCIEVVQQDYALTKEEAKRMFMQIWLHTFGICALVAFRVCRLTEEEISDLLTTEFQGVLKFIYDMRK